MEDILLITAVFVAFLYCFSVMKKIDLYLHKINSSFQNIGQEDTSSSTNEKKEADS